MDYYMPTKVHLEKDSVKKHTKELTALGTKALIVTGRSSSKKNGSLNDVTQALTSEGVLYIIFDEIEENPSVETVMKGAKIGIEEHVDFVIGIGGGSPMDASKGIALMIANPEENESLLYDSRPARHLPVVAVPTTAGTGSEVTPWAILTRHDERTKQSIAHRIFPTLALVDHSYMAFASRDIIVCTAIDALAHLIESYLNTKTTIFNRMATEYGLRLWGSVKNCLLKGEALSEQECQTLILASTIAGISIAHTGTSLPHGMSYYLTYEHDIPHGNAVGIFLPAFLDLFEDKEQVKRLLTLLDFKNEKAFTKYIDSLFEVITLREADVERYIDGMLSNKRKLANYPFTMTDEKFYRFFKNSVHVVKPKKFSLFGHK
ncbi:MAG: iron-containing alcohol dehydrogenase [Lachnospiraceae bacterium]|nr:iron-containing alcohol dehydrogenase [Lachnospiraceae bacterium]